MVLAKGFLIMHHASNNSSDDEDKPNDVIPTLEALPTFYKFVGCNSGNLASWNGSLIRG
jgi:hypothetical protein